MVAYSELFRLVRNPATPNDTSEAMMQRIEAVIRYLPWTFGLPLHDDVYSLFAEGARICGIPSRRIMQRLDEFYLQFPLDRESIHVFESTVGFFHIRCLLEQATRWKTLDIDRAGDLIAIAIESLERVSDSGLRFDVLSECAKTLSDLGLGDENVEMLLHEARRELERHDEMKFAFQNIRLGKIIRSSGKKPSQEILAAGIAAEWLPEGHLKELVQRQVHLLRGDSAPDRLGTVVHGPDPTFNLCWSRPDDVFVDEDGPLLEAVEEIRSLLLRREAVGKETVTLLRNTINELGNGFGRTQVRTDLAISIFHRCVSLEILVNEAYSLAIEELTRLEMSMDNQDWDDPMLLNSRSNLLWITFIASFRGLPNIQQWIRASASYS